MISYFFASLYILYLLRNVKPSCHSHCSILSWHLLWEVMLGSYFMMTGFRWLRLPCMTQICWKEWQKLEGISKRTWKEWNPCKRYLETNQAKNLKRGVFHCIAFKFITSANSLANMHFHHYNCTSFFIVVFGVHSIRMFFLVLVIMALIWVNKKQDYGDIK